MKRFLRYPPLIVGRLDWRAGYSSYPASYLSTIRCIEILTVNPTTTKDARSNMTTVFLRCRRTRETDGREIQHCNCGSTLQRWFLCSGTGSDCISLKLTGPVTANLLRNITTVCAHRVVPLEVRLGTANLYVPVVVYRPACCLCLSYQHDKQ